MKLETQRSEVTEGNLTGTDVQMQVSADAMEHIMDLFTRLYEDARLAILREYSTNGTDAHIEAGVDRAIDVTLPNALNPFLRIRDYGIGLTAEDIAEIYSQYGASTKRNTNTQVGALGMGCKSGLAYTEQFTITSRKDGKTISVIVSRAAKGGGSMKIVDERPMANDEEQGTEITIAISRDDIAQMDTKAREFFKYWPKGSVRLNGQEPERIDGMWLTDDLCIVKCDPYAEHRNYIVMGNVPYPVDTGQHRFDTGLDRDHALVAFVPIGAVSFTPSREALRYEDTEPTKRALDKVIADFAVAADKHGRTAVSKARTKADALKAMIEVQKTLPQKFLPKSYTHKGVKLPAEFSLPDEPVMEDDGNGGKQQRKDRDGKLLMSTQYVTTAKVKDYVMSRLYAEVALPAEAWPRTIWIHGFEKDKLSADQKRKMDAWVEERFKLDGAYKRDWPVERYALLKDKPSNATWLDPKTIVLWETINARKLPVRVNGRTGSARIPGSYDLYELKQGEASAPLRRGVDANAVMAEKGKVPLFWLEGNQYAGERYRRALDAIGDPYMLVLLPGNRVDKFKRTYTHAVRVRDAVQAQYDAWLKTVSADQRNALSLIDAGAQRAFLVIDSMGVKDPELVECGRLAKLKVDAVLQKRDRFSSALTVQALSGATFKNPLNNYPVWDASVRYNTPPKGSQMYDHMKLYLNAAYAARVKGDL